MSDKTNTRTLAILSPLTNLFHAANPETPTPIEVMF